MSDSKFLRLCCISDIPDSGILRVTVPGYDPLAVCQVDGAFFAIADTCSHGMASLSEGDIEDGQIFCPFHGGGFEIATGNPTERPCTIPIATYPVKRVEDALFIASK
ncbi:non-heme iron oxygenase ferredoxin subunit [Parasphingopyxis lamellibrachiae]|uniref:Carbazole 1,9a-dioxygenase ferredoxin component/p-cumate 2,3-dioxygenase ferredoxin subunit n=1 Tax=Parasphingopyxis lamellibrachiae TaxID=680125 RepID=A0A3D9F8K7_9SPHN|nr:non-heme iron oxygenase ferredoxin subunit [Parasphingopyxis lamellibrachiae]RED13351.1 carbazole 1,9a-dioxygenase ferredoxin component/p-cumate 2,3-dioxygenase ferredoxin subunit [Parasphingopyxis lamellibrachiae]